MTQATIAPTPERIAKGGLERPVYDQKQKRDYYRHQSPFERLHNGGQITQEQALAGMKLERHMIGASGADARMDDGGPSDLDGIGTHTPFAIGVQCAEDGASASVGGLDDADRGNGAPLRNRRSVVPAQEQRPGRSRALVLIKKGLTSLWCNGACPPHVTGLKSLACQACRLWR